MKVAFTGHRPQHFTTSQQGRAIHWIETFLRNSKLAGDLEVITGMALGVDTWAAAIALDLAIPYHAYIPFSAQAAQWTEDQRDYWKHLVDNATSRRLICTGAYAAWKFQKRNEAMVDDSNLLAAVMLPGTTKGGTFNCVQYALKVGREIKFCDTI